MKALILVDIQYDFTTGGNLEVKDGESIIPLVNRLQEQFELVVATQDWHPSNHLSFASNHQGRKPFETITLNGLEQRLWHDHCVQGTHGAEFHDALDMKRVAAIFRKGMDPSVDSYSGFYDNGRLHNTGLAGYLRDRGVTDVFVVGLAGDYCVYFTARDALLEGFACTVIADATRSISEDGFRQATSDLQSHGGVIIESRALLP